ARPATVTPNVSTDPQSDSPPAIASTREPLTLLNAAECPASSSNATSRSGQLAFVNRDSATATTNAGGDVDNVLAYRRRTARTEGVVGASSVETSRRMLAATAAADGTPESSILSTID